VRRAIVGVLYCTVLVGTMGVPRSAWAVASASPTRSAPLKSVMLRLSDLRPGYTIQQRIYLSISDRTDSLGVGANQLRAEGWRASFDAYFRRGEPSVDSTADQYGGANGAHWGFLTYMHGHNALGVYGRSPFAHFIAMPRVGNESMAYAPNPSNFGGWSGILFREGPDVVNVSVSSTGHDAGSALALARLVDKRIQTGR